MVPAAPSFRNEALILPAVGWLGLRTADVVVPARGWSVWDQPTIGAGYRRAIGYQLWLDVEADVGMSTTASSLSAASEAVATLRVGSALRYDLLDGDIRPYVAARLEFLQLFPAPSADVPTNGLLQWPVFVEELSVQLELGATGFIVPHERGLGGVFLPAPSVRLSWNIYF
jgi:hypothetical protein